MAKQKLKKQDTEFTQVKNNVLKDNKLSWKAKGLFAYLYSKPEDWDFAIKRIAKDSNEGEWTVRTGLKELEERGYLVRQRQSTGRINYLIRYDNEPHVENQHKEKKPHVKNRTMQKPHYAKINTVSNKEVKVIKSINNKEDSNRVAINPLIELFKDINPTYEVLFKNKTQRGSLENLVKKFGVEKVEKIINTLQITNKRKFAPTITTPYQLEKKLGDLMAYIQKEKQSTKGKEIIV